MLIKRLEFSKASLINSRNLKSILVGLNYTENIEIHVDHTFKEGGNYRVQSPKIGLCRELKNRQHTSVVSSFYTSSVWSAARNR